jgi:uncharacterized protein YutE (UPF0331/DUF86 family)
VFQAAIAEAAGDTYFFLHPLGFITCELSHKIQGLAGMRNKLERNAI